MDIAFATSALARYKARQCMKQVYRRAGRRSHTISYRQLCEDADRYFVEHREECLAWARAACAEFKTSRPKTKR